MGTRRGIIGAVVQVGAVKIYVAAAAVEALRKKNERQDETQETIKMYISIQGSGKDSTLSFPHVMDISNVYMEVNLIFELSPKVFKLMNVVEPNQNQRV